MSTKTKFILTYVGGIVTGIILVFVFAFFKQGNAGTDDNVVFFEEPQQTINAEVFKVIQVYPDGSALALIDEPIDNYGTVVAFQATKGQSYYDDQKITVPSGKCVRQVGTYRYITRQNMEKTVPIVQIFDE